MKIKALANSLFVLLVSISNLTISHPSAWSQEGDYESKSQSAAFDLLVNSAEGGINRVLIVNDRSLSRDISYLFHTVNPAKQDLSDLISQQQVQSIIELSDDQKKILGDLKQKLSKGLTELTRKYEHRKDLSIPEVLRNQFDSRYQEEVKKLRDSMELEFSDLLVPRQINLIRQFQFNQSVKIYGYSSTLVRPPFSKKIDLDPEQVTAIQKIKKEAEAEIEKKLAEIRARAKAKMLRELSTKQKETIKELEGKKAPTPKKL